MSTVLVKVVRADVERDIFQEGNLVESIQNGSVFMVTCVAQGYEDSEGSFWAINLSTGRSEGFEMACRVAHLRTFISKHNYQ